MSASRPTTHTRAIQSAAQPGAFSSSKSHRDLVRALRALSSALVASAGESIPVAALARELAVDHILKTSRPDIHLSASLCIVELFKLSAPNAPWHGQTLRDVLRMLVKQVALIDDTESSKVMLDQFHILESLAVVKIPIVLLDDDIAVDEEDAEANLALLVELFQTSMQIASRGLPQQFENCIRDMLSCVLEEADPVPKPLVVVLCQILIDRSTGAQRSCDLSKRVVRECKGVLEPTIAEIIAEIASKDPSETAKQIGSRSRQSELIYELAVLDPGILRSSTHRLQDALESPDEDVRLQFVKLFGRIFSSPDCPQAANEFSLLLNAFMKRATDISGRIREEFVARSGQILAQVPDVRVQLTTILAERALDPCDKVRTVLVRSICELALNSPEAVELSLLEAIGGRLLDKKVTVRLEAIQGLSSLFKTHCSRYWSDSKPVPVNLKKFSWIPNKLVSLFMVSFPDKSQSVDHIMDETIIDKSLDARGRTLLLLATFATCDQLHQKAFIKHYVTDKRQAASLLDDALSLRDRLRAVDNDEETTSKLSFQVDQRLQSLISYLPTTADSKSLQSLFDERDGNIFKWLRLCIDTARDTSEVRAAITELHGALSTSKKLQSVADAVAVAVSMVTLSRDNVQHLFDIAARHANRKLSSDSMTILLALAEQAPLCFTGHLQQFADAVKFDKKTSEMSDFALHVSALCSSAKVAGSPKLSVLERFCRSGSESQSTWAATVLCNSSSATASLRGLLDSAGADLSQSNSKDLLALLSACAIIARLQPQLFHDHALSSTIVDFALDTLRKSNATNQNCIALRLVTDYVVSLEERITSCDATAKTGAYRESILTILWSLLSAPAKAATPLLAESINAVLSLIAIPHLESSVTPNEFAIISGVMLRAQDDIVRTALVDQLWKRLVILRIPFRYATLLALVPDGGSELGRRARKLLGVLVGRLRQASAIAARSSASGSKSVSAVQMPEYALAHLLHALAAQDDFDWRNAAHLRLRAKYIGAFVDALLGSNHHNFAFIIALMTQLRSCIPLSGTERPLPPERLYALVDLTMVLIKRKYQGQEWSTFDQDRISKKIPLPAAWFRLLPGPVEGSYLPASFALKLAHTEAAPSPHRTPSKAQATPKPERSTPGRKRRKSIEPASASPPKASRQLPPRRAKRSLASISSLLDSDEDSDVISHEYEQIQACKNGSGEVCATSSSPMKVDSDGHADPSDSVRSPSPNPMRNVAPASISASPTREPRSPSVHLGELPGESDGKRPSLETETAPSTADCDPTSSFMEEGGDSGLASSQNAASGTVQESVELIDVLMNGSADARTDENTAPETQSDNGPKKKAPHAVMRSTFRMTRSRRRTLN